MRCVIRSDVKCNLIGVDVGWDDRCSLVVVVAKRHASLLRISNLCLWTMREIFENLTDLMQVDSTSG